jgi:hypothetical protein
LPDLRVEHAEVIDRRLIEAGRSGNDRDMMSSFAGSSRSRYSNPTLLMTGILSGGCHRDAVPVHHQRASQHQPDTFVVIDHESTA